MGATADFTRPSWNNSIDEDIDAMRDNFNYLLALAVAGSQVAPGWSTAIVADNYAQPDSIILSKADGRVIKVNVTWA